MAGKRGGSSGSGGTPSGADTATTYQAALTASRNKEIGKTVRTAFRVFGWCFAVLTFYWIAAALAGHATSLIVRVALNLLVDFRFVLSLLGTAAAGVWAVAERRLRQRTIERLHPRIKQLESLLDLRRSTSNLTPKGDTNPMDDAP